MASCTRCRVSGRTRCGELSTLDTVCTDTLACRATVVIVTRSVIRHLRRAIERSKGDVPRLERSSEEVMALCLCGPRSVNRWAGPPESQSLPWPPLPLSLPRPCPPLLLEDPVVATGPGAAGVGVADGVGEGVADGVANPSTVAAQASPST